MSKSVIDYLEETFNNLRSDASDEEAIRACVSADARISPIIEDHKLKSKNLSSSEEEKTPIPTGDDIRRLMMRPIIDDNSDSLFQEELKSQQLESEEIEPKAYENSQPTIDKTGYENDREGR